MRNGILMYRFDNPFGGKEYDWYEWDERAWGTDVRRVDFKGYTEKL